MAARRMMKRRGRPRPMDWVANNESWDLTTAPFILDPFLNPVPGGYATSNAVGAMLTFHKDLVDELNEMGSPQLEQTAIRVVGDCHFWLMTFDESIMPTVNLLLDVNLRLSSGLRFPTRFSCRRFKNLTTTWTPRGWQTTISSGITIR